MTSLCKTLVLLCTLFWSFSAFAIDGAPAPLAGWPMQLGGDVYTAPVTADLDGDGIPEIIVSADKLYALKGDGSSLPGWPKDVPDLSFESAVAVGDLDGDGKPEVVVSTFFGSIHAFHANGTRVEGFPLPFTEAMFTTVMLADLDGDGRKEVIAHAQGPGMVYVWGSDGTLLPGWPVPVPGAGYLNTSPTVADLDNDGNLEVLVPGSNNEIFAFHIDGTAVAGWPVLLPQTPFVLVAGDLRHDGRHKIFAATTSGKLYGLNADGSAMPGWPKIGRAPALADLDGDGNLEVVTDASGCLMVYRYDGSVVPGWPRCQDGNYTFSPVIGDIDGDGGLDVAERASDGLYAWHADGTPLPGFPIPMTFGRGMLDAPLILGDVTGAGHPALITGSTAGDTNLYAFTVPAGNAPLRLDWPMQQRDAGRSGGITALPVIVADSFSAAAGVAFSQQLTARNASAPSRWTVSSGALPPGITLSASGTLSGVPLELGTFTFTLKLTDATGTSADKTCTFQVQTVAIQNATLPAAPLSVWYSQQLTAVGGTPPYSWAFGGGALPPGITLDPTTGVISGYPNSAGDFAPVFRVTDSIGQQGVRSLPISVTEQRVQPDPRPGWIVGIELDPQGNVYTVEKIGNDGGSLVKTAPDGAVLWSSKLSYYYFHGMRHDTLGNLFFTSVTPSNLPDPQVVTTKIDPAGQALWTTSVSGTASGMAVDDGGNLYLAGASGTGWLTKLDPSGTVLWQADLGIARPSAPLALDSSGAPHILCEANGTRFIVKFSPSGQELERIGISSGQMLFAALTIDRDDNIILATDWTLTKLTPAGAALWSAPLDFTGPFKIATDSERNIYLTGSSVDIVGDSHAVVVRYDASGRLVWSKKSDGAMTSDGYSIALDEVGRSLYLAGTSVVEADNHPVLLRLFQPQIVTSGLPPALAGLPFSQPVAAQRGKAAYTWSVLSGTLPAGLQLDASTGVISGTPSSGGSYPVTLLATDANGIADARSLTLSVAIPVFTDFSGSPLTGFGPLVVDFSDLSTNLPTSWLWSFGDGTFATGQNPDHTYALPGNYSVSLTVNGMNGTETTTKSDFVKVLGCANEPITLATQPAASFSDPAAAYAQAQEGDVMMMQSYFFNGGLTLNRNIQVTLKGGYKCGFMGRSGSTVFHDTLRVQDGTVRVDTLTFR